MKPAPFAHHAARSLDEAVQLLAEFAPQDGRILAGGQSLVPIMAFRLATPAHLIDINRIPGLDGVAIADGALRIGATVRHAAFERGAARAAGKLSALLAEIVRHVAHAPIRSRGTFCGSLAHSDPASEWCLAFATLGGTAVARGPAGARDIDAAAFFSGIMATALEPNELLAEARLPLLADDARWGFYEHSRRAGDYAMAMTLATWRLQDGRIVAPRVGVGGAESMPRRIAAAEAELAGQPPEPAVFVRAADAAAADIEPMEDAQADAGFRRDLVRATTSRALAMASA